MEEKVRRRLQLNTLYEMFRDRIEENVIYIVYSENECKINTTLDQLMSIASCAFTGHDFEPKPLLVRQNFSPESPAVIGQPQGHNSSMVQPRKNSSGEKQQSEKEANSVSSDDAASESKLDLEERIKLVQSSIDDLLREKKSSHDKSSLYLSKKMYLVTSYYSELASQLRRMIEEKTNRLVDLLLQKSKNSNYIDLHGLNPIQARLVVAELLKIRQNELMIDKQGEASIDIITGWGKHKVTEGQRIKPAIVALLREKGFEYQHLNKGALRVTIRR